MLFCDDWFCGNRNADYVLCTKRVSRTAELTTELNKSAHWSTTAQISGRLIGEHTHIQDFALAPRASVENTLVGSAWYVAISSCCFFHPFYSFALFFLFLPP